MAKILAGIVSDLVDHPEDVSVEHVERGEVISVVVRVHDEDLPHVIGDRGRTARALRTLVSAFGIRNNQKYSLDIRGNSE